MGISYEDILKLGELKYKKLIVGGAALPFYGVNRGTIDIDIEVFIDNQQDFEKVQEFLDKNNIQADLTNDFERWNIIPLPNGFKGRLIETEISGLFVLSPVDYIFSKIRRGTLQDVEDSLSVFDKMELNIDDVIAAKNNIELPLDPLSIIFNGRFDTFISQIGELTQSSQSL